jgi:hypothetical protein
MRGSGGSFGITTSIEVTTFPAPPTVALIRYNWDLSVTDAASAIAAFQSFVQTDIPRELGTMIGLTKGSELGRVAFQLFGNWYGHAEGLNATMAPLLSQMPISPQITWSVGSYINSVAILGVEAGSPTLNTSSMPEKPDTFYAKSIMTPESSPMTISAIRAYVKYLAHEGYSSTLVCRCLFSCSICIGV